MPDPNTDHKEFLYKEYEYFSTLFRENEETGEKRLTYYNTLATGVIGGVVALLNTNRDKSFIPGELIYFISTMALLGLFLIGNIVFWRLAKRNHTTDCYKKQLDNIRDELVKIYPATSGVIERNRELFEVEKARRSKWQGRFTSLVHITGVLNSLILCLILVMLLFMRTYSWERKFSWITVFTFLLAICIYYLGAKRKHR